MQSTNLNVAIIALTCGRPEETRRTYAHNLTDGYPLYVWHNEDNAEIREIVNQYDPVCTINSSTNMGIAAPLNRLAQIAFEDGADMVITMANDILEPEGWVQRRIEAFQKISKVGVVAIPPTGTLIRYPKQTENGIKYEHGEVIGNYGISKECFETVGGLYTGFGIYGPIDLEYCHRCWKHGYKTIYIEGSAEHIGDNDPPEYKKAKMDSLRDSWQLFKNIISK
jgi:GT2 family glycosyltransferase